MVMEGKFFKWRFLLDVYGYISWNLQDLYGWRNIWQKPDIRKHFSLHRSFKIQGYDAFIRSFMKTTNWSGDNKIVHDKS